MGSSIEEIEQRWKPIEYRMDRPAQRVRWAAESDMRAVLVRLRELEAENARLREAGDVLADALKAPVTARIGARNHYLRVWDEAKRGTHG